eukprot:5781862-Amphidinium_carterae.1
MHVPGAVVYKRRHHAKQNYKDMPLEQERTLFQFPKTHKFTLQDIEVTIAGCMPFQNIGP